MGDGGKEYLDFHADSVTWMSNIRGALTGRKNSSNQKSPAASWSMKEMELDSEQPFRTVSQKKRTFTHEIWS